MHGWSKLAAASASRRNRLMCAFVAQRPRPMTFSATMRLRLFWRAIDDALAAAANFLHQLVVAQFFRNLRAACSIDFLVEHSKTRLQHAGGAKSFRFVDQNCG